MAEKCANTSSLPSSGAMKPKPLSALNHLTVPVAITGYSLRVPCLVRDCRRRSCVVHPKGTQAPQWNRGQTAKLNNKVKRRAQNHKVTTPVAPKLGHATNFLAGRG